MPPAPADPSSVAPRRESEHEGRAATRRRPAPWKVVLLTLAVLAGAGSLVGAVTVYGGLYNVAATASHLQPTYSVLQLAMEHSVRLRARHIEPPPLDDPRMLQRGAACYRDHCVQCHGAPGVAPDDFSKSMQPVPVSLINAARHWRARELYWITREGIKMSGMPAWEYHLAEPDLWAVVAFLTRLPTFGTPEYEAQMVQPSGQQCRRGEGAVKAEPATVGAHAGNAERGRAAMREYACIACHNIPGVTGGNIHVGPSLEGFGRREWIAGQVPNTADNLVAWLLDPQRIDPDTAMPDMGITPEHARDMAAYLKTLD